MQTPPRVTVIALAGHLDSDLIPHFLSHYRNLGAAGFAFALHGDFDEELRHDLARQPDIEIFAEVHGQFTERSKVEKINWMLHGRDGEWVLMCDLDEFIELPADSLAETISIMERAGMTSLPALLVQRLTEDGSLPELAADDDIDKVFSRYSFNLAERLGSPAPPIKTKFPLCKVARGRSARDGFHFPLIEAVMTQQPLRATLSHYKWRKNLRKSVLNQRGKDTNDREMAAYRTYLDESDASLPLEGSHPYDRADLIGRGLLVPARPDMPSQTAPAGERLRICLVTRELTGPFVTGGAGTATSAMVENLAAHGHSVHILYIPYEPWGAFDRFWTTAWETLGAEFVQMDITDTSGRRIEHRKLMEMVVDHLERNQYDIAHFDDAHALGAKAFQLRASGLGLQNTAMVMTTHGCSYWHSANGTMPRNRMLATHHFAFEQQASLADLVIHPSRYMKDWVSAHVDPPRNEIVLPNVLTGLSRSFLDGEWQSRRPDEIVFFGRIEPRKGWDIFLQAVEQLRQRGETVPRVTLLGRIGESLSEESVRDQLEAVTGEVRLLDKFRSPEAIHYLKAQDCLVVIPSLRDNLPYTVYECLENGVPMICSDVGGIRELVDERDWARTLVASDPRRVADAIAQALSDGWIPARLAFDADEAARRQAAAFTCLHEEEDRAREAAGPATGSSILALCFAEDGMPSPNAQTEPLRKAPLADLRVVADLGTHERDFRKAVAEMNRQIAGADEDYVLLCHRSVHIMTPDLPAAMARMLDTSSVDAIVCDYYPRHVSPEGALLGIGAAIEAPGGPPQMAPSWNIFGAGIALIRRSSLVAAGMIDEDSIRAETLVWEVLNKICAKGGSVTSIPRTLVCKMVDDPAAIDTLKDQQLHERLSRHWLHDLDDLRGMMLAAAIFEGSRECPYTRQLLHACNLEPRLS